MRTVGTVLSIEQARPATARGRGNAADVFAVGLVQPVRRRGGGCDLRQLYVSPVPGDRFLGARAGAGRENAAQVPQDAHEAGDDGVAVRIDQDAA